MRGLLETNARAIDDLGRITGNYIACTPDVCNATHPDPLEIGFVLDHRGFHTVFLPGSDSTDVWDEALITRVGDWSDLEGNVLGFVEAGSRASAATGLRDARIVRRGCRADTGDDRTQVSTESARATASSLKGSAEPARCSTSTSDPSADRPSPRLLDAHTAYLCRTSRRDAPVRRNRQCNDRATA